MAYIFVCTTQTQMHVTYVSMAYAVVAAAAANAHADVPYVDVAHTAGLSL